MVGAGSAIQQVRDASADAAEAAEQVVEEVTEAAREAHPWIEALARWGLFAKGTVYLVVGVVAIADALRPDVRAADTRGVLSLIGNQPLGTPLLALLAIGLCGYALWREVQAVADADDEGSSPKGIASRVGKAASGLVYAGLGYSAIRLLLGAESRGLPNPLRHWTDRVLSLPWGAELVGIAAAAVIGIGLNQFRIAWRASFCRKLYMRGLCGWRESAVTVLGRFGYAGRGALFTVIGLFLFQSARESNPNEARGIGESLHALTLRSYGPYLVTIVAAGLSAYGLYMFVEAMHRRIEPPAPVD